MQNAHVVLFVLKARFRSVIGRAMSRAKEKLTEAFRPLPIITGLVGDLLRTREELVVRWHQEGFRLLWRDKSKSGRVRRSPLAQETIELIGRMSKENRLWGADPRRAIEVGSP